MLSIGDLVCFSSNNSLYPVHRHLNTMINGILLKSIHVFNVKWCIIYTAEIDNKIVWISTNYVNKI